MNPENKAEQTEDASTNRVLPPSGAPGINLSSGGFGPDTEVMTSRGPISITDLSVGDYLYALDPVTRVVKQKPVTAIQPIPYDGDLVSIETRRAQLQVAGTQRIPFWTKADSRIRFERACDLANRSYYKFINSWRTLPRERLETVDIIDYVDDYEICASTAMHGHTFRAELPNGCEPLRNNGHTGYHFDAETFERYQSAIEAAADEVTIRSGPNHHRRPYRFDGDDFIEFLGWFITEGSVHWPKNSDTAQVKLAQETESYRRSIASLFDRMGLDVYCDDRGLQLGSKVFGDLLESLCGASSHQKRLPPLVWNLPREQQQILLDVLLAGDGNDRQTYYTASNRLAKDVLRLCLEVGIKPRYTRRDGIWQIYVREVNDGFQPANHVQRNKSAEVLYRLSVADYSVIMAGQDGKFQWVGVSSLS